METLMDYQWRYRNYTSTFSLVRDLVLSLCHSTTYTRRCTAL